MSDKFEDDLESTRVSDIDKLRAELTRRSERDRAYLIVLAGADVGKMFKLGEGETSIGRSHRADIRLDDDFTRHPVTTAKQQRDVIRRIDRWLANPAAP